MGQRKQTGTGPHPLSAHAAGRRLLLGELGGRCLSSPRSSKKSKSKVQTPPPPRASAASILSKRSVCMCPCRRPRTFRKASQELSRRLPLQRGNGVWGVQTEAPGGAPGGPHRQFCGSSEKPQPRPTNASSCFQTRLIPIATPGERRRRDRMLLFAKNKAALVCATKRQSSKRTGTDTEVNATA